MNYSYTFNLKEPNSNKETLIYIRARIKDENKYLKYSTGEKIHPKFWDSKTQFPKRISGRSAQAVGINSIIAQITRYGEAFQLICTRLEADETSLTVGRIKAELNYLFKRTKSSPGSFLNVFNDFIQEKRDLAKITKGTIQRYINIKQILEDFSDHAHYKLTFGSITNEFYVKFVSYSRKELRHKNNTLGRNIGFIKTFMNWAANKKLHRNFDFKNFEKTSSETDEVALSMTELEELFQFDFKNKRLEQVRDVFVFGCTTGMRYSDYSRIGKENIRNGQIVINTVKQKSNLGIPLNKYSTTILEKYDYALPLISAQKFREYIKEACKKAGFNESIIKTSFIGNERIEETIPKYRMISTHTARRTFITLSLEKGMRPDIVMSITGHKSYSSFKKYIKLSKKIREDEMSKAWN